MERKIICAVTGRNIFEIGNGQSESYYKNVEIKLSIIEKVSEFAAAGVTDFMCTGEWGFPLWSAEIIIGLRQIRVQQGLNAFRLHIVMPHELQGDGWSDEVHERLYMLHGNADSVLPLYRRYRDDCYENSERFMIDRCDFLFTDDENEFAAQYAQLHSKPFFVCKMFEHI